MSVDHVAEAQAHLAKYTGDLTVAGEIAMAQVHATLADAEQKRIANVLALAAAGPDVAASLDGIRAGLAAEVWEAVGLS